MYYTNADSLLNKRDELTALVNVNKFDIIGITEILPKNRSSSIDDVEWCIPGYNKFSENFDDYTGRGIIVYIKESITAVKLQTNYTHVEIVQVAIPLEGRHSLLVQCLYRSPNSDKDCIDELKDILTKDTINGVKYTHRLLLGDFIILKE